MAAEQADRQVALDHDGHLIAPAWRRIARSSPRAGAKGGPTSSIVREMGIRSWIAPLTACGGERKRRLMRYQDMRWRIGGCGSSIIRLRRRAATFCGPSNQSSANALRSRT